MVGIQILPLTIFLLVLNTETFGTAILQHWYLKKPMKSYEVVGMIGCYTGVFVLVYWSPEQATKESQYPAIYGFLATLVAGLGIAMSSIAIH